MMLDPQVTDHIDSGQAMSNEVKKILESFFDFKMARCSENEEKADSGENCWKGIKLLDSFSLDVILSLGSAFDVQEKWHVTCFLRDKKTADLIVDFQVFFSELDVVKPTYLNPIDGFEGSEKDAEILRFVAHSEERQKSFTIEKRGGFFSFCTWG